MSLQFEIINPDPQSIAQGIGMTALALLLCDSSHFKRRIASVPCAAVDRDKAEFVLSFEQASPPFGRSSPAVVRVGIDPVSPAILGACEVWADLWNLHAGAW